MQKELSRRVRNRVLAHLARAVPGATSLRPALHRLRGVVIGENVFIGDEVYLENEFPELISIGNHSALGPRVMVIAHVGRTDQKEGVCGQVKIGNNVFIGAGAYILTTPGCGLTIGDGAVIGACSIINRNVREKALILPAQSQEVGTAELAFTSARSYQAFLSYVVPLSRQIGK